jgi:hypothetical protein
VPGVGVAVGGVEEVLVGVVGCGDAGVVELVDVGGVVVGGADEVVVVGGVLVGFVLGGVGGGVVGGGVTAHESVPPFHQLMSWSGNAAFG